MFSLIDFLGFSIQIVNRPMIIYTIYEYELARTRNTAAPSTAVHTGAVAATRYYYRLSVCEEANNNNNENGKGEKKISDRLLAKTALARTHAYRVWCINNIHTYIYIHTQCVCTAPRIQSFCTFASRPKTTRPVQRT